MKLILLMAITADGMIARSSMELIDWTGKADKQYFVRVTKKCGVMVMGSRTYDTIGRVLPERKSIVMTRDKSRVSDHPDLVFTDKPPEALLKDLEQQGFESATLIGGSVINTLFMEKGLIDEIHLTIVPKMFGKGLTLFEKTLDAQLRLLDSQALEDGCMVMRYEVLRRVPA